MDLLRGIKEAQNDLHRLYEEVRQYAAPLTLDLALLDVREVVDEAWDHLEHERSGRVSRLVETGRAVDHVCEVDRFALRRVFRNLFENALQACSDPVQIEVACDDARVRDREALRIAVRDNGPGLGPEQRQRLFETFYTTKTHGTGLGMAIVRRIVEAHGGAVAVEEEHRSGAGILVTLPRRHP